MTAEQSTQRHAALLLRQDAKALHAGHILTNRTWPKDGMSRRAHEMYRDRLKTAQELIALAKRKKRSTNNRKRPR